MHLLQNWYNFEGALSISHFISFQVNIVADEPRFV